jgi:hypothetical protein
MGGVSLESGSDVNLDGNRSSTLLYTPFRRPWRWHRPGEDHRHGWPW